MAPVCVGDPLRRLVYAPQPDGTQHIIGWRWGMVSKLLPARNGHKMRVIMEYADSSREIVSVNTFRVIKRFDYVG